MTNATKMWHRSGYAEVRVPEHPFSTANGTVREHRLVMEAHIGRYLSPEEVVHHIDGDTSNNSIENLQLFATTAEHTKHHRETRGVDTGRMPAAQMLADLRAGFYARRGGQFALATDLGVTRLTLASWQAGKSEPTHKHWQAICALWEGKR